MAAKVWASSLISVAWVRVDPNDVYPCDDRMVSASAVIAAYMAVIPLPLSDSLREVSTFIVSSSYYIASLVI